MPEHVRLRAHSPRTARLTLLNGFELRHGPDVIALPISVQRLLALLALQVHPVQRPYVAGTLWFATNEAHAQASLRSALWRLRRCDPDVVEATRTHLHLSSLVVVDLREQVAFAHRLLDPSGGQCDVADSCSLLEGELLPDWYDDWVLFERERLRQLRLHVLDAVAERMRTEGRYGEAVEVALTALRIDPLRESAHSALIKTHLAEGNRQEALRHYRLCRDLLRRKLRLEPAPELSALVQGLLDRPDAAPSRGGSSTSVGDA